LGHFRVLWNFCPLYPDHLLFIDGGHKKFTKKKCFETEKEKNFGPTKKFLQRKNYIGTVKNSFGTFLSIMELPPPLSRSHLIQIVNGTSFIKESFICNILI
jgi:hypothetical protein